MQQEHCEKTALLRAPELQELTVVFDLKRSEYSEIQWSPRGFSGPLGPYVALF
jgi:hypothetical protein